MHDYEHTLHYLMWKKWDQLFMMMIRTKDDLLERKIHHFLHAYYYTAKKEDILINHQLLLQYLDHALKSGSSNKNIVHITDD